MTLPSLPWFQAPDTAAQREAIATLVQSARSDRSAAAVGALITLLHLARDPSEQLPLLRALGETGSVVAVPALHGELHRDDPAVRAGALRALGATGLGYAGLRVAAWLAQIEIRDEPSEVLEAALLALGQTGHASLGETAVRLWEAGRARAEVVHLALAEGVSDALLDLARDHLADPVAAIPAALQLSAVRPPTLGDDLARLRQSTDPQHRLVGERLAMIPGSSAEDDMLALIDTEPLEAGRVARGLREHPSDQLVEAFEALLGLTEGEARKIALIQAAVGVGVGPLQDAALQGAAALGDAALASALREVAVQSAEVEANIEHWIGSPSSAIARAAIRLWVNLEGVAGLDRLDRCLSPTRPEHRVEQVRALQDTLRDWAGGPNKIPRELRLRAERVIREGLRSDAASLRRQAAYAAGNIGLNALGEQLRTALTDDDAGVREAAAAALDRLPPSPAPLLIDRLREEPEPAVRFRLALALRKALEATPPTPDLRAALPDLAQHRLRDREDLRVLGLRLLGYAPSDLALESLCRAAEGSVLSESIAAISALGTLADPAAAETLIGLLQHPDPARRWRAAEALGPLAVTPATLALLDALGEDGEPAVRQAALTALRQHPLDDAMRARIQPTGPDDPLLFELLALVRGEPSDGTTRDVDMRLEQAIEGFNPARLHRRCPDALRALRTAEFLSAFPELPEGLDAAPPVLQWAKGLELWATDALSAALTRLALPEALGCLESCAFNWTALPGRLPDWPDTAPWPPHRKLVEILGSFPRTTPSLNNIAAIALVAGPLAQAIGLPRIYAQAHDEALIGLASSATSLARLRNELTHRRAARPEEVARARRLAHRAATGLVLLR